MSAMDVDMCEASCPEKLWCPIPGGIQGQAGCGSGQPGLVVGDPAHSRGLKLDDHCDPFQPRPFYDTGCICNTKLQKDES